MNFSKNTLKHTVLATAVATALGAAVIPHQASAAVLTFNWSGVFTLLDSTGGALSNTSIAKGSNSFQTPVSGTMTFDTVSGAGSATLVPFNFFSGSLPAEAVGITMQAIGDGQGGQGPLVLGNMLFNWDGKNGIPVSLILDAEGMFNALGAGLAVGQSVGSALQAASLNCETDFTCGTPGSNGTYTDATWGYLDLGTIPVATLDWNTTNTVNCQLGVDSDYSNNVGGGCMNILPSGQLPLVADTAANLNRFDISTPTLSDTNGLEVGIGGNPMQDGPFQNFNANFDITLLTLIDDGSGPSFTPPADVSILNTTVTATPATVQVSIGTVADEPGGATVEYSIDGKAITDATKTWLVDNGTNNIISLTLAQTVTSLVADWRVTSGSTQSFATQNVTVTIDDTVAPVITGTPAAVTTTWPDTATPLDVCFGAATATDAIEPNVVVEYAINAQANWQVADPNDNCSTTFGLNQNTVYWRARDAAVPTPNISPVTTQTVTLNLPTGIVGTACVVDLQTAGQRLTDGRFTMRDSSGAIVGNVDNTVTGVIDTTLICPDETCATVGATLSTTQPFFGELWVADPVRLFDQGTWTFEACLNDGSSFCTVGVPTPVSMTVGAGQLGAHMLFDWSVNTAIDVVVVWDVACGNFELTATDPDGDGILGTRMVDGPFKGFNAAFDVNTQTGEPPIADGGFQAMVPVAQNPVAGASPLPIATFDANPVIPADPDVVRSCVGGCFAFETPTLVDAGTYKYAQVVIPLNEATPFYSVYRKFDGATWGSFVINTRNDVKSAPVDPVTGFCPEPGDGAYTRSDTGILAGKLNSGEECLQLTIEDNGPNDGNAAPDVVADPGGVAQVPTPPPPPASTSGGGCAISSAPVGPQQRGEWWLMAAFLGWLGWMRRKSV